METYFSAKEGPITFLHNIKTSKTIKDVKDSQEGFNEYLKMIQRGNKTDPQKKHCQILICFLMEELMLLNLQKNMVQ